MGRESSSWTVSRTSLSWWPWRSRIFEPFYRADPGRSRDRDGSGLGLSIVAAVVAAHGGEVQAQETEGGPTFRVELPLAAAE